ncbi:MAG: D-lyxose/D-mannose family sugar isomerase [Pirellulales bacterium]
MMPRDEILLRQQQVHARFRDAGIILTDDEKERIEIADFGLSDFERTGLGVLVYVNTERCCAKELAMWPRQTCPQHRHPNREEGLGKEETFRCRRGTVYLYVSGTKAATPKAIPPLGREHAYTVWHEIELRPGGQYTIHPDQEHWFQAGDEGAVVSEFSTRSTDEYDLFADAEINRFTKIV